MFPEHFVPHLDVVEGVGAGDIAHEHCAVGVFEISGDQAAVALLSSSVPHLHSVVAASARHVFHVEIYAYCGLGQQPGTLWVSSKLLRMARSMIELFPTPWSPRNTTRTLMLLRLVFDDC